MQLFRIASISILLSVLSAVGTFGQNMLRHSYVSNGYTYVGTERSLVKAGNSDKHPFLEKLDYVIFPDESTAYILEIDYEEERNFNFPKEVELRATTQDGKIHRFKQYAGTTTDKHQFTAADEKTKVYWNVGKYMLEEDDVRILCSGIKNLEVVYSWAPDGFYTYTYTKDEFSSSLRSQVEILKTAADSAVEIGDIVDYVDNLGSTTVVAKPVDVDGNAASLKMQMTYLYYKSVNSEDFDITMAVTSDKPVDVPYESVLEFTFADGSTMSLKQEREGETVVFLYPTVEQVKKLAYSPIKSVRIPLVEGFILQEWDNNEFGEAVRSQYNTLQAVSVL